MDGWFGRCCRCPRETAKKRIGNHGILNGIYVFFSSFSLKWPLQNLRAHVNISHYFLIWSAKLQPLALNCSFFDSSALQSSCTTATISIPFVIAVWDPSIRMMTNVLASLFRMMDTHYKAANSISEFGFPIFISKFSSRIAPARYQPNCNAFRFRTKFFSKPKFWSPYQLDGSVARRWSVFGT